MPRTTYSGLGEISDVCIKRKIRNRLQDMGECIFVQSDDNKVDKYDSLYARGEDYNDFKKVINGKNTESILELISLKAL